MKLKHLFTWIFQPLVFCQKHCAVTCISSRCWGLLGWLFLSSSGEEPLPAHPTTLPSARPEVASSHHSAWPSPAHAKPVGQDQAQQDRKCAPWSPQGDGAWAAPKRLSHSSCLSQSPCPVIFQTLINTWMLPEGLFTRHLLPVRRIKEACWGSQVLSSCQKDLAEPQESMKLLNPNIKQTKGNVKGFIWACLSYSKTILQEMHLPLHGVGKPYLKQDSLLTFLPQFQLGA